MEDQYVNALVEMCGVSHAHETSTLGYMCEQRGDVGFAPNEVLREAAKPTFDDDVRLKTHAFLGDFCAGLPSVV